MRETVYFLIENILYKYLKQKKNQSQKLNFCCAMYQNAAQMCVVSAFLMWNFNFSNKTPKNEIIKLICIKNHPVTVSKNAH